MESPSTGGDRTEYMTIQITRSARNRLLARALVTLALGVLFSFYYAAAFTAQREKAENLTLEAYTENFENYKAKLLAGTDMPQALIPVASIFVVAFLVGSYELLVFLIAWLLGKVLRS
ncbi:MAG: hypothetical protein IGS48_06355 [Oscillatoriales cyanobacterium C42_A2020_001]|nr:hypothetical protein [Leptolyngbyaceae cyanobacterium C42_A2020_001]